MFCFCDCSCFAPLPHVFVLAAIIPPGCLFALLPIYFYRWLRAPLEICAPHGCRRTLGSFFLGLDPVRFLGMCAFISWSWAGSGSHFLLTAGLSLSPTASRACGPSVYPFPTTVSFTYIFGCVSTGFVHPSCRSSVCVCACLLASVAPTGTSPLSPFYMPYVSILCPPYRQRFGLMLPSPWSPSPIVRHVVLTLLAFYRSCFLPCALFTNDLEPRGVVALAFAPLAPP